MKPKLKLKQLNDELFEPWMNKIYSGEGIREIGKF